jgi:hypothetical protein
VAVLGIDVLLDDLAAAGPQILADHGGHDCPSGFGDTDP